MSKKAQLKRNVIWSLCCFWRRTKLEIVAQSPFRPRGSRRARISSGHSTGRSLLIWTFAFKHLVNQEFPALEVIRSLAIVQAKVQLIGFCLSFTLLPQLYVHQFRELRHHRHGDSLRGDSVPVFILSSLSFPHAPLYTHPSLPFL